jgi:hypothetical protein
LLLNGATALAQVSATLPLGCRRRKKKLVLMDTANEVLMPRTVKAVLDQACDHHLMHCIDQTRRTAPAAKDVADVNDIADARAFATEFGRDHDSKQAMILRGSYSFGGKARGAIDCGRMRCRDCRDRLSPLGEGAGNDNAIGGLGWCRKRAAQD